MKQASLAFCSALGLPWPAGVTVEIGFRVSGLEPPFCVRSAVVGSWDSEHCPKESVTFCRAQDLGTQRKQFSSDLLHSGGCCTIQNPHFQSCCHGFTFPPEDPCYCMRKLKISERKETTEIRYYICFFLQMRKPRNRGKVIDPGIRSTWEQTWNQTNAVLHLVLTEPVSEGWEGLQKGVVQEGRHLRNLTVETQDSYLAVQRNAL